MEERRSLHRSATSRQRLAHVNSTRHDLCSRSNHSDGLDQPLSLESLSSLFTRLILQNHLTRLAGHTLGLGGRGVWECNVPAPSCAQPNCCSSSSSSSSSSPPPLGCQNHSRACSPQSFSCGGDVNMCGHANKINVCHACPATTVPYMTSNNVFVIPALQQHPGAGGLGNVGYFNLNHNNLNHYPSGLGTGLNGLDGATGGPAMNNNATFSCRGCGLQM